MPAERPGGVPVVHPGGVPAQRSRALVGLVPPEVLERAAGEVSDRSLAAILRAASRLR